MLFLPFVVSRAPLVLEEFEREVDQKPMVSREGLVEGYVLVEDGETAD